MQLQPRGLVRTIGDEQHHEIALAVAVAAPDLLAVELARKAVRLRRRRPAGSADRLSIRRIAAGTTCCRSNASVEIAINSRGTATCASPAAPTIATAASNGVDAGNFHSVYRSQCPCRTYAGRPWPSAAKSWPVYVNVESRTFGDVLMAAIAAAMLYTPPDQSQIGVCHRPLEVRNAVPTPLFVRACQYGFLAAVARHGSGGLQQPGRRLPRAR